VSAVSLASLPAQSEAQCRRLVAAELLKLRRRRTLLVASVALIVAPMVVSFIVLAILHAANPTKYGPAGGVDNLRGALRLLTQIGTVAAVLIGVNAGGGDLAAGVFRELVVTGRSRLALFLSRIPAGLVLLIPFAAAAFAVAAISSVAFAGSLPAPDTRLLVLGGLWALLEVVVFYLLAVALSCLIGSRSYTIGILLAFRLAVTPILASISALGVARELLPGVAIGALQPAAFGGSARQGPPIGMSVAAIAAVLLVWTVVALVAAAWRDTTRDA
jgi:ABC-type transport system involved in multi-copper enzyme maturation permease subunit